MDGSKSNDGTECGAILHQKTLKKHFPKEASIFSPKICAINLVLKQVSTSCKEKFIIHSDSFSVLQSLKNTKLDNPFIVELRNKLISMNHSKKVIFCWIPSHRWIQGNNKVDSFAKAALNMVPNKKSKIPYTDQANNFKEMATIMEENPPQQAFPSTAHF